MHTILEQRGLAPRTLGETDYSNSAPILAVREVMEQCSGAIILGFAQLTVSSGRLKPGTTAEQDAAGSTWATAWNQIEAAMAYALGLPVLVIREQAVAGGVFDFGSIDRFVHQADLTPAWFDTQSFLQPLNAWIEELTHKRP
jgi:hypothetical protein